MRKLLLTIGILAMSAGVWSQEIKPVERTIGKLRISVDPRMELLSAIQVLSDYKVINKQSSYSKDIQAYFKPFATHKAVSTTDLLLNSHGFSFDAPVAFMLYLSPVPELRLTSKLSDYLSKRAGGERNLESYRVSIKQFAKESDFREFWLSHEPFYKQVIDYTINDLGDQDLVKVIEGYFNESQNSYSIIISPSFVGGYGPQIKAPNGKMDIYSCMSAEDLKDGVPYLNKKNLIFYVWHEFGHSFVNHNTDKFPEKVASLEKLFEPIREEMAKIAYRDLSTCINELVIRAINVRLQEIYIGPAASIALLGREIANRFVFIEPVVEKLKEFEKLRDSKNITFSEFYPQILDLLDSLQKSDYLKNSKREFNGPINAAIVKEKIAWIYPTNDNDTASLRIVKDYLTAVFNKFKSEGSVLISDSVALTRQLSDYGIMAYGTIESNLFLSKYKSSFPFKIENNTIYADSVYKDENIKLISCLPNPHNSQKGMVVYTASSNKNIPNINNVFHGGEDYILFLNRNNIIGRGYYDKIGGWKFIKTK